MKLPKNWRSKIVECSHCKIKPNGSVTLRVYADDIVGRIWCPNCHKTIDKSSFGISRYKMWALLIKDWNSNN